MDELVIKTNVVLDHNRLLECYQDGLKVTSDSSEVSICGKDLMDGCFQSMRDNPEQERQLQTINDFFKSTYIDYAHQLLVEKFNCFRGRFLRLKYNSNYKFNIGYPFHTDPYNKIHIPLSTNPDSMILYQNDRIYRMNELGRVYFMNAKISHTALNLSDKLERVHLVWSTGLESC